jgi:hypothetical protein
MGLGAVAAAAFWPCCAPPQKAAEVLQPPRQTASFNHRAFVPAESPPRFRDSAIDESFSMAPTAWRTAGAAIAEVTNRWQCDPRWSFLSLENDLTAPRILANMPAVMWSKYEFPGDLFIEFFVGNKMESQRGQPYFYARDINVTICSDGADLNKGYTFMWGGFNNDSSMILRNGVKVASVPARIPRDMNYTRHWFHVTVEKRGARLSFRVDRFLADEHGQPELVYEDPQPLTGNRLAIWTWDHAISIARVRLSGRHAAAMESPEFQPGPLRTPLD